MAIKPDASIPQITEGTYRCPGCGEVVDSRHLEEVLAHHQHVLHPSQPRHWFERLVNNIQTAGDSPRQSDAVRERRQLPEASPAARSRRYGHG